MEQKIVEKRETGPELLPLVVELIPGQAAEGLINIYEVGSFEKKPLRELIENTLNKKDLTIEERLILEDIKKQLDGGILLCGGSLIHGTALDHAVIQETEKGEKYYYVAVRAIKPQEGGFLS